MQPAVEMCFFDGKREVFREWVTGVAALGEQRHAPEFVHFFEVPVPVVAEFFLEDGAEKVVGFYFRIEAVDEQFYICFGLNVCHFGAFAGTKIRRLVLIKDKIVFYFAWMFRSYLGGDMIFLRRLWWGLAAIFGFRPRGRSKSNEEARLRWERRQAEIGAFDYDEEGFYFPFEGGGGLVRWAEVDRIVAYKLDVFASDEICVELHVDDRAIRFAESTPGWYQFLERLRKVFPGVPEGWDWDVARPSFAFNYTFLYEREGGELPATYNFHGSVRRISIETLCAAFEKEGWALRLGHMGEREARNSWSEISLVKDRKNVTLMGRVAIRSGRPEEIERLLYGIGEPFQYEFYDGEKKVIKERKWP